VIDFLQTTEGAITAASVYILIGFGWNLVYNSCGYLNLAIGEFYILGAVLAVVIQDDLGVDSVVLRGLMVLGGLGLLGMFCELVLLRPVSRNGLLRPLIVTLGIALVVLQISKELAPGVVIRPDTYVSAAPIDLGGVRIAPQELLVWGTAVLVSAALIVFFGATDLGRRVRAAVDSPPSARLLGIRTNWYMTAAFAASAVLAGLAAFVVAPTQGVNYNGGTLIAIKAFIAVAIFGLGHYGRGVAGAFVVALAEAYLARYWNPAAQQIVILTGFLIVLYVQAAWESRGWREVSGLAARGRALWARRGSTIKRA
jgi:branched-chain amino acid transport system permease protein